MADHIAMKICIDISPIIYGTGVSVYTKNLVENLLEIDKENEYVLFGGSLRKLSTINRQLSTFKGNFKSKVWPLPPTLADVIWNRLHILPIEFFTGKVDVFHASDWTQPPSSAFKVTTIHDLVPIRFPQISHPKIVSAHKARLKWVKKEVDRIIAVSEATKKEIVELLEIDAERIVVVPEAADPSVRPATKNEAAEVKKKFGIEGDYLFCVGTDPRKNISRLVGAFKLLVSSIQYPVSSLVIAGNRWPGLPDAKGVKYIGHVAQPEKQALYSGAVCLVYASLYEGFGIPILEAMQAGCPVVTSNISSMPEVAGDAAVLVDPHKVDSITEGIKMAIKGREELVKKGFMRAKQFSWEKTAKETLGVYTEASR